MKLKKIAIVFSSTLFLCGSLSSHAEVYRWKDKDGKTHFSDTKPKASAEDIKTQDITAEVKQQNIDTSSAEHQKLEKIFRKENAADREYEQQQQQTPAAQLRACAEAKEYLRKITGRVQFYDQNGKPVNVTETERKAKVAEATEYIQQNCP